MISNITLRRKDERNSFSSLSSSSQLNTYDHQPDLEKEEYKINNNDFCTKEAIEDSIYYYPHRDEKLKNQYENVYLNHIPPNIPKKEIEIYDFQEEDLASTPFPLTSQSLTSSTLKLCPCIQNDSDSSILPNDFIKNIEQYNNNNNIENNFYSNNNEKQEEEGDPFHYSTDPHLFLSRLNETKGDQRLFPLSKLYLEGELKPVWRGRIHFIFGFVVFPLIFFAFILPKMNFVYDSYSDFDTNYNFFTYDEDNKISLENYETNRDVILNYYDKNSLSRLIILDNDEMKVKTLRNWWNNYHSKFYYNKKDQIYTSIVNDPSNISPSSYNLDDSLFLFLNKFDWKNEKYYLHYRTNRILLSAFDFVQGEFFKLKENQENIKTNNDHIKDNPNNKIKKLELNIGINLYDRKTKQNYKKLNNNYLYNNVLYQKYNETINFSSIPSNISTSNSFGPYIFPNSDTNKYLSSSIIIYSYFIGFFGLISCCIASAMFHLNKSKNQKLEILLQKFDHFFILFCSCCVNIPTGLLLLFSSNLVTFSYILLIILSFFIFFRSFSFNLLEKIIFLVYWYIFKSFLLFFYYIFDFFIKIFLAIFSFTKCFSYFTCCFSYSDSSSSNSSEFNKKKERNFFQNILYKTFGIILMIDAKYCDKNLSCSSTSCPSSSSDSCSNSSNSTSCTTSSTSCPSSSPSTPPPLSESSNLDNASIKYQTMLRISLIWKRFSYRHKKFIAFIRRFLHGVNLHMMLASLIGFFLPLLFLSSSIAYWIPIMPSYFSENYIYHLILKFKMGLYQLCTYFPWCFIDYLKYHSLSDKTNENAITHLSENPSNFSKSLFSIDFIHTLLMFFFSSSEVSDSSPLKSASFLYNSSYFHFLLPYSPSVNFFPYIISFFHRIYLFFSFNDNTLHSTASNFWTSENNDQSIFILVPSNPNLPIFLTKYQHIYAMLNNIESVKLTSFSFDIKNKIDLLLNPSNSSSNPPYFNYSSFLSRFSPLLLLNNINLMTNYERCCILTNILCMAIGAYIFTTRSIPFAKEIRENLPTSSSNTELKSIDSNEKDKKIKEKYQFFSYNKNVFGYHELFHIFTVIGFISLHLVNFSLVNRVSDPLHGSNSSI